MQQDTSTIPDPPASGSWSSFMSQGDASGRLEREITSQRTHIRRESSTSDEFGSFVSVPASDDPLGARSGSLALKSPITSSIFDTFADDAKQRSKDNERRVLDDLRAHEKDPLGWLSSCNEEALSKEGSHSGSNCNLELDVESSDLHLSPLSVKDARESERGRANPHPEEDDLMQLSALNEGRADPTGFDVEKLSEETVPVQSFSVSALPGKDPLSLSAPYRDARATSSSFSLSSISLPGLDISEGPKERAERNGKRILDELHAHEDDPLGWLMPRTEVDDAGSSALQEAGSTLIDLNPPASEFPVSPPPSPTPSVSSSSLASPSPRPSSLPRAISSPLIPHSPDRARSQSPTARVPKSPSIGSNIGSSIGLSRSWMSSLGLFGTSRAVPASSSSSAAHWTHDTPVTDAGSAGLSPTQSSLHALFAKAGPPSPRAGRHARFATEGHSPMHAATMPLPSASTTSSDTSPFASHVYVPPSGAPGFAGDHNWNPGDFEFDTRNKTDARSIRLVGRNETTNPVLDSTIATALRPHLPPLARLAQSWKLLYSADQHGLSLNTLYARCTPPVIVGGGGLVPGMSAGALVAVQDAEGGVFGAWVPEGVHLSHGSYYGGGDSFLWSAKKKDIRDEDDIHVYKWTGRNGYVAYCDTSGFSFGGGDGHYGLYVDSSLVEGTTHPCPTFDNEVLAHGEQKGRMVAFDAVGLEVWSIGS